jgi:CelD/BcsL family acetyltransferase involved in cellulose biosynthesis
MLEVEVHRGRDSLHAASQDWLRLLPHLRRRRFLHEPGWWKCYLEALDPDPRTFSVFVVKRDGAPVAILPLVQNTQKWFGLRARQWKLPDHAHLPLGDILCRPDANAGEIITAISRALRQHASGNWDMLSLTGVLDESPLARLATDTTQRVFVTRMKTCDYLTCQGPYEGIVARLSKNFRSNLNKARNKLARETGVTFRSVTSGPELAGCFADFLNIENSGWKGAAGTGTAIKLHPELLKFYQLLMEELAPTGAIMLNSLHVGDKVIASQYCVTDQDSLYVLKLAYDEEWARVAPGNLLLERVIQAGLQAGSFQQLNLVGEPPWFKDWAPDGQDVHSIRVFNGTIAGRALHAAFKTREHLKPYLRQYLKRDKAPARRPGPKAATANPAL